MVTLLAHIQHIQWPTMCHIHFLSSLKSTCSPSHSQTLGLRQVSLTLAQSKWIIDQYYYDSFALWVLTKGSS